jgi:hypothetical protein
MRTGADVLHWTGFDKTTIRTSTMTQVRRAGAPAPQLLRSEPWLLPLASAAGFCRWLLPLAAAAGCCRWLLPLASAAGCCRWLLPLAAPQSQLRMA